MRRNSPSLVVTPGLDVKVQMLVNGEVVALALHLSGETAWRSLQDAILAGEAFRDEEVILSAVATQGIFAARVV